MRKDLSVGTYNFNHVTLKFYQIFENFNLAYNFWTVSVRAFICHVYFKIQDLSVGTKNFDLSDAEPWSLTYF